MRSPVAVVRTEVDHRNSRIPIRKRLWLMCPGCDDAHSVVVWQATGVTGPVWGWDGDLEHPTVSPSLLVQMSWAAGTPEAGHRRCHSFVRAGRWEYLTDCTHELAGQTVDLAPLPDWLLS